MGKNLLFNGINIGSEIRNISNFIVEYLHHQQYMILYSIVTSLNSQQSKSAMLRGN